MSDDDRPVHFYVENAETLGSRILCGDLSAGVFATKVAESRSGVTCVECLAILAEPRS